MNPLEEIKNTILDDRTKGIPGGVTPFLLGEISAQGWNVLREDLPLPLMLLKQSALENNTAVFRTFVEKHGLSFAPHGKTTMAPQLFHMQLEAGAWGMTAATIGQVQVYRRFGIQRILLANQVVGRSDIAYLAGELNRDPDFEFYCLVDSIGLVALLTDGFRAAGLQRPLQVLLEVGMPKGRTGCRSVEAAQEVLASVHAASDVLSLAGVEGYEGLIPCNENDAVERVDAYLAVVKDVLASIGTDYFSGRDEVILSAGGTAYFDRVASVFAEVDFALPVRKVLRSGCYLTSDSGVYGEVIDRIRAEGQIGELKPAIEAWSYVQSLPEPGLAILMMGKRDVPYDAGLPTPERRFRAGEWADVSACEITATNDQHAYMQVPDSVDLQVGDMIACGISHPCTAFDKWRFIPVVDDEYNVVDGILTFF
jgi:D-serine dehydratase